MSQPSWSSKLNFIIATTGAAVGLGAIWKFPYTTGTNGGGAFVLVAMLAIVVIGIPIMMGEMLLGRLARCNPIDCLSQLAARYGGSPAWTSLGYWGCSALILVLSFYSVIAGWSIAYTVKLGTGSLQALSQPQLQQVWTQFLASPAQLLLWHSMFMLLTLFVVAHGLHAGLEQASKWMMFGLFIILLALMGYSAQVGDWGAAVRFLLWPDFSKLSPSVMIDALGQAAFSLAIGAGCMLTYGRYTPQGTPIGPNVCLIAGLIMAVSLCSGLCIFPLVFSFNLPVDSGPGLLFNVLPMAFNQMPFGQAIGCLFFLMLLFAAWTSSISMAEPLVVLVVERWGFSRLRATACVGGIAWSLGVAAMLSFNVLSDVKLLGRWDIFSFMADFATNIILPTGALGFAWIAGWKIPAQDARLGLEAHSAFWFRSWRWLIRYVAPLGILVILLAPIWG